MFLQIAHLTLPNCESCNNARKSICVEKHILHAILKWCNFEIEQFAVCSIAVFLAES